MKVTLGDLAKQYESIGSEIDAAVRRVLASGRYIMGEDVGELERELAADAGLAQGIAVSSGSDALLVALWALGVGPGDEVITSALSFFAPAGAIARLGATPVFADIDAATFNVSSTTIAARITPRTKAIVPVHLFGRVAEWPVTDLPVVEDAAQAIGAPIGKGRATTLSFFPAKNLGAAGDAGMVLTNDDALADRMRLYRVHGARPKYHHLVVGANLRMDTLQAAILRVKRRYLAQWNAQRRANAMRYHDALASTPLVLPTDVPGHVWHHYVVRAPRRDELRAHLRERGIETEVYYPTPLHLQPCFAGGREGDCPEAERACREVLALPVHPELEAAQLDYVSESIAAFYR
jgi:dTDP-4-amino-4,6-dideoxygalactose transaminase